MAKNKKLYHGAALYEIARHEKDTLINAVTLPNREKSRASFEINNNVFIYLKYRTKTVTETTDGRKKYQFIFNAKERKEIKYLYLQKKTVYIVLVIHAEHNKICCIDFKQLRRILRRQQEDDKTVYIESQQGHYFRVFGPGCDENDKILVPQIRFPNAVVLQD